MLCLIAVCVFVYSARDIYQVVNVENEFSTKEEAVVTMLIMRRSISNMYCSPRYNT